MNLYGKSAIAAIGAIVIAGAFANAGKGERTLAGTAVPAVAHVMSPMAKANAEARREFVRECIFLNGGVVSSFDRCEEAGQRRFPR